MKLLMRELRRVLKDSGSCWVNIGDTYSKGKSLSKIGIPCRFMIQSIDDKIIHPESGKILNDYSWMLRNDIVWEKPNAMPSSIKNRLTNRYEPLFFFVKNTKYYFNVNKAGLSYQALNPF